MNAQAQKIIQTARGHIGITEMPPNSNNVRFNTAYYGREVSGPSFPWCVVFVWYVFREAGLSRLFFGGERTAHSNTLMTFARRHGLFHASGFQPGDIAFFDWSGQRRNAQHVGIIEEVRPNEIITIEGNTAVGNESNGGAVMQRRRNLSFVIGTYRPEYEEDREEEEEVNIDEIRRELTALSGTGVQHSSWASDAVTALTQKGVFNGDGSGNFGWNQLVTREALAQIIHNLLMRIEQREEN